MDDLREDLPVVWRSIPEKPLFFALAIAWLTWFQFLGNSTFGYIDTPSLFGWLNSAYNSPGSEDGHGNLIPFLVLGLMWWKRDRLRVISTAIWWPGLFGLAGAGGLHLLGYIVQQPRLSVVALVFGLYAIVATVWGWRVAREIVFPYVLMVFCVPLGALAEPLTIPLRQFSTDITVGVVRHGLGIPILREGVQLADPRGAYQYEVAAACSGINSLITLLVLTTVYAFVSFSRTWKRGVVIALALPLAVAGNVLRLVTIIVASEAFGRRAGEFVHEWFGFVTFALAMGGLLVVGHWLREPENRSGGGGLAPEIA